MRSYWNLGFVGKCRIKKIVYCSVAGANFQSARDFRSGAPEPMVWVRGRRLDGSRGQTMNCESINRGGSIPGTELVVWKTDERFFLVCHTEKWCLEK